MLLSRKFFLVPLWLIYKFWEIQRPVPAFLLLSWRVKHVHLIWLTQGYVIEKSVCHLFVYSSSCMLCIKSSVKLFICRALLLIIAEVFVLINGL